MFTLNELKQIVEQHMKNELGVMELTLSLENKDVDEFTRWYINHPISRGIREVQEIVRRGPNKPNQNEIFEHDRHSGKKKRI
ncbi:MAG: hypothetical protein M3P08_19610 [Thermoproteota archaeon]|nr:hypothetical protein [Thermoproteota archaeon]